MIAKEKQKRKVTYCHLQSGICFSAIINEKAFDEVKQEVQCEHSSHIARAFEFMM